MSRVLRVLKAVVLVTGLLMVVGCANMAVSSNTSQQNQAGTTCCQQASASLWPFTDNYPVP
ncbi:MAG: hypothetical protein ABSD58_07095 [Verrucomicrobiia bacterium]|jgi:hypothetical protein